MPMWNTEGVGRRGASCCGVSTMYCICELLVPVCACVPATEWCLSPHPGHDFSIMSDYTRRCTPKLQPISDGRLTTAALTTAHTNCILFVKTTRRAFFKFLTSVLNFLPND